MSTELADHIADVLTTRLGWHSVSDVVGSATDLADGLTPQLGSRTEAELETGESLRDGLLRDRFLAAVRRINPGPDGEPWLDDDRLAHIWDEVTRRLDRDLVAGNEAFFKLLQEGVAVPGLPGWQGGRRQVVQLIEWDDHEANDLLVVTHLPVVRPADGGLSRLELDVVLFFNGIPFVVIACAGREQTDGVRGAIDTLRALTGQRELVPQRSVPDLFRYVQVLIAAGGDEARLGTITSLPEHYAAWRTTAPHSEDQVALDLDATVPLTTLQTLLAGAMRPEALLDLVRSFSLFRDVSGRRSRIVARFQQYRAVLAIVRRLAEGGTPDGRSGLLWHTQGSGKSLTMSFLIRKIRTVEGLKTYKVVIVSDRVALKQQLTPVLALSGERPRVAETAADGRALLADPTPGVIQLMMQQARPDDATRPLNEIGLAQDGTMPADGALNTSEQIVLLIDEAHRTQTGTLHARLRAFLPNAALIGFTGTPIVRPVASRRSTREIFGADVDDPYTLIESERDGATVPIRYEGRHITGTVVDRVLLDTAYEEETGGEQAVVRLREVLESTELIGAKARDMLVHWVTSVLPGGFKAQVVAVSRLAAVRYRDALLEARRDLVDAAEAYQEHGGTHDGFSADQLSMALRFLPLLRSIDFVPVISGGSGGGRPDPAAWSEWTLARHQQTHIDRFQRPFPGGVLSSGAATGLGAAEDRPGWGDPWSAPGIVTSPPAGTDPGGADPWSQGGRPLQPDTSFALVGRAQARGSERPIAFLIVQAMLLTGFDAPIEQALYVDRPLRQAELLQAIARTNRPARGKPYGLVVDYVALTENLDAALAEYEIKDLHGMRDELVPHELPLLRERAVAVRDVLGDLGGSPQTDDDWDRLLFALEDQRRRARFDRAADAYLESVARLLPRREAMTFDELTRVVGRIQWRMRRRFRDTGTGAQDPYRYGALLRGLLDQHLRAEGAAQKVPPVEITDPGFREAVDALRSGQTRALEYEHALRHHIDTRRSTDPARYDRLSGRLEAVLQRLDGAWESLAEELGALIDETLAPDADIEQHGLDPIAEGPIFNILVQQLAHVAEPPSREMIADIARDITGIVRVQIRPPHFPESSVLQENLRRELTKSIALASGIARRGARPAAEQIVQLAVAQRDRLL